MPIPAKKADLERQKGTCPFYSFINDENTLYFKKIGRLF